MKALDNEHKIRLTLAPKTPAGNPARVDGVPVWESSNPDAFTVEPAEDGLSGYLISADTGAEVRSGELRVTADADLGDGVRPIAFTETIVVGPAEAGELTAVFGEPEPK
ncbi:MAG: hypothetical protein AB7U73_01955 [Pirellulales bacterium]